MSRKAIVLLAWLPFAALGADPPKDPFAGAPQKADAIMDDIFKVHSDPSGRAYFRQGTEHYYTKYLATMKEPSMFQRDESRPASEYRFLWLRSFHDPIAIRVWRTPEGLMLRALRVSQNRDYSLGATTTDTTRKLTAIESQTFAALVDGTPLTAPMNDTEELSGSGGADGARWIFETYGEKRYQRIDFWCLKDYGPKRYEDLGLDTSKIRDTSKLLKYALGLLNLGGIKIPDNEVY